MPKKIKIIYVKSLSYTGTTWLNTVLGCHEDAFTLGPLDLRWKFIIGEEQGPACLIHADACDFWPSFQKNYSPEENFFIALAEYSGKTVFVTNNLLEQGTGRYLDHPDIEVLPIHLVRDGRALVASYLRKFPDKQFIQGITEFLQPSFSVFEFLPEQTDLLSLRYEDIMSDQSAYLSRIGQFVGLDYAPTALRFWEWQHHLVFGNPGTLALLRMGEGLSPGDFVGAEFYKQRYEQISSGDLPAFVDKRHEEAIKRLDLYIFDQLAGADNERFGYERDVFSSEERKDFEKQARNIVDSGLIADHFAKQLCL